MIFDQFESVWRYVLVRKCSNNRLDQKTCSRDHVTSVERTKRNGIVNTEGILAEREWETRFRRT